MSPVKILRLPKLTLLGAICVLVSLTGCLVLLGHGSEHVTALITLVIGPTIASLLTLYQSQLNGGKADTAATIAADAKDAALTTSVKTDAIHLALNGTLDARLLAAVEAGLENRFGVIPGQPAPPAAESTPNAPADGSPPFPVPPVA